MSFAAILVKYRKVLYNYILYVLPNTSNVKATATYSFKTKMRAHDLMDFFVFAAYVVPELPGPPL
jgi:hypothetical protein